jgi:hypothetical protein
MPEVCSDYTCYWLDHEELPEEFRPDRIGVVVTESGWIRVGGQHLAVFLFNQSHPGARRRPRPQALLDALVAKGAVVMVLYAETMELAYDRTRYSTLSPEEIETACRYEQSQDAEELKRLGAVSDDFAALTWEEARRLTENPSVD